MAPAHPPAPPPRTAGGVVAAGALLGAAAVLGAAWAQSPRLARLLARQRHVVIAVPTRERLVALTLDDGPHPSTTPVVLDALGRHGARATFFLLGSRVAAHPDLARAVVEAGHEVGNHGWADTPAVLAPAAESSADLDRTTAAVRAATGTTPVLTRPGSGWVRPAQVRAARARGLATVLGSIATRDPRVEDVGREARFVLRRVRPGSVVVLHEGASDRAAVAALLEHLLPALTRRGYRAVTVSELLASRDQPRRTQRSSS